MISLSVLDFKEINNKKNFAIKTSVKQFESDNESSGLSIKIPLNGCEYYKVGNKYYKINSGEFFLVNKCQDLKCQIDSSNLVESICVYLDSLIYQEIINCNANNYDIDLKLQGSTFEVLTEKYFIEDCDLSIYLQKLKSLNNFDSLCEEDFILLTEHLANHQRGQKMMLSSIETLNLSTKIELFRRLRLAKSFIFENYQSGIDLESIAEVSCLSKYYLLRSFKEVYKVTPYQAILERRINKAKELLVAGNNINEVAINSGFQNTRSFSRAFKNKVGIPPSLFV